MLYEYWNKGQVTNPRKRSVMQELNAACAKLKTDKAVASVFGTGLNEWKGIKAAHAKKIKVLTTALKGAFMAVDHYRRSASDSVNGKIFDDCLHIAKVWASKYQPKIKKSNKQK